MFVIIGIVVVLLATIVGYTMHGGSVAVLIQINEFVVIGGAGLGSFLAANGMAVVKRTIAAVLELLKPNPFESKDEHMKLLVMMYQLFSVARRDGLLGLEPHMEDPHKSTIISKNHAFLHHHHCTAFFCDTMKVVLTGAVSHYDLNDLMELDLDTAHREEHGPVEPCLGEVILGAQPNGLNSEILIVQAAQDEDWGFREVVADGVEGVESRATGQVEIEDEVIYHKTEYRERRNHFAFFACSAPLAGFDTQREAFLGPYRGWENPLVVERGESANSVAYGWQPVGSHHVRLELAPGETRQVIFLLGYHENPAAEKFDQIGRAHV